MATAAPPKMLISSEEVEGTDVYGMAEDKIGQIDHLMIDKISGRIAYAVMSFGGFMGLGNNYYPIPWAALKYDPAINAYRTGVTQQQLENAPEFAAGSWGSQDWELQTHQHYGAAPYWQSVPPAP